MSENSLAQELGEEKYYKVSEVAELFSVKAYTVREWVDKGLLGSIRLSTNNQIRIPLSEIKKLVNARHGDDKKENSGQPAVD